MRRQPWRMYGIVVAILGVGLLLNLAAVGTPLNALLIAALVLAGVITAMFLVADTTAGSRPTTGGERRVGSRPGGGPPA